MRLRGIILISVVWLVCWAVISGAGSWVPVGEHIRSAWAVLKGQEDGRPVYAGIRDRLAAPSEGTALLARFQKGDPDTREHAAAALGELGETLAVEALTAAARDDPDARVREHACSALGSLADERAVLPLLEVMLTDPDARVRKHAAEAIGQIVER